MVINLSGELIPDDWAELYRAWGYSAGCFCPSDLRMVLAEVPDGEDLVLVSFSVGGCVDGCAEIYSLIQACKNPTRAVIQSMAASAASYMIMACDAIDICLPAQMMIHCAWGGGAGNQYEHQQMAQALGVCDESILACYAKRCQGQTDKETLRAMMEAETFIGAQDAVAYGLADNVIGGEASEDPQMMAASVCGNLVRAMRVIPDISVLKAKRDAAQEAQARAELETEIGRFRDLEQPNGL